MKGVPDRDKVRVKDLEAGEGQACSGNSWSVRMAEVQCRSSREKQEQLARCVHRGRALGFAGPGHPGRPQSTLRVAAIGGSLSSPLARKALLSHEWPSPRHTHRGDPRGPLCKPITALLFLAEQPLLLWDRAANESFPASWKGPRAVRVYVSAAHDTKAAGSGGSTS